MRRRDFMLLLAAAPGLARAFDPVSRRTRIEFPRDRGAHPGHRVEWWYVTGQLESAKGALGFQVTFFRAANPAAAENPGRFSARQLLFAHAAISDAGARRLIHDQRAARWVTGLVDAAVEDTAVRLDGWKLERAGAVYRTRIDAEHFSLDLELKPTQPVLLQGQGGFSRKGPSAVQASHYYSEPHLEVAGRVAIEGEARPVKGRAWLDHEWSSEMLAPEAVGWDWLGVNLDDGGALMAFRIRRKDGTAHWAGGTFRPPGGEAVTFAPEEVRFIERRLWRSPATGTEYPVAMVVVTAERTWEVEPIFNDQELDARASTGTLYWEGAVRVNGMGRLAGRGYLELTGYGERMRL